MWCHKHQWRQVTCSAGDCIHQLPVILQQHARLLGSRLIETGKEWEWWNVQQIIIYGGNASELLQHFLQAASQGINIVYIMSLSVKTEKLSVLRWILHNSLCDAAAERLLSVLRGGRHDSTALKKWSTKTLYQKHLLVTVPDSHRWDISNHPNPSCSGGSDKLFQTIQYDSATQYILTLYNFDVIGYSMMWNKKNSIIWYNSVRYDMKQNEPVQQDIP